MFDRTYILNLDRRPERLAQFQANLPADWPLPKPQRFVAIDGERVPPPPWWNQTPGGWGCLRSHLAILERCLNRGIDSVLIFEDDAILPADFTPRFQAFMANVPDDWNMVYLGGCCRKVAMLPPEQVNEHVVRCPSLTGTWAFGYRGMEFMRRLYVDLDSRLRNLRTMHHVDIMLCHLHEHYRVYAPARWIVKHSKGTSDTRYKTDKVHDELRLPDPASYCGEAAAEC